ncbi:MAG: class I SAM-dependent methyltransferase [bacterium]|nr:class I SAM-dependent methyltransferase [bacterium]
MDKTIIKNKNCRICSSQDMTLFLSLGEMPLANAFLAKKELTKPEPAFPLDVYFCKNCSLVQLCDIVDPKILFKNYTYLTSASRPLVKHFVDLSKEVADNFLQSASDLVVEIGSNDGVLLGGLKGHGQVLGIEPDEKIADLARNRGIRTLTNFFTSSLAEKVAKEFDKANVILANNVVAHINDLKDVFDGIKVLLADDGVFIFEVHWVGNLIGDGGFDQIYHEHLSYFSLNALNKAADLWGLKIVDVKKIPIHGQSLRVYMKKTGEVLNSVEQLLEEEGELGLLKESTYHDFAQKVKRSKDSLVSLLMGLKEQNKTIVGYGAPAKGNTLLNYYAIDGEVLDCIIDTTPFKQGLYTPGTHIPVLAPEVIKKQPPDYLLLLAWNYAEQIIEKEKWYLESGGKFIHPLNAVIL